MVRKWGWTDSHAESKFQEALADPGVAKGVDEEGCQTVAKYASIAMTSGRVINHQKEIRKTDAVNASTSQLGEMMQSDLHMN